MGRIRSFVFGPAKADIEILRAKYGSTSSKFITLPNGTNTHLRDEGNLEAPTIVFVHGHSEDLHTWDKLMKNLERKYRIVRYDLRRHGLTGPAPDNEYKIENYVSDLSMLVDHLEIETFVLLGHSMGGRISLKYSMANPERVNGLILLSASGAPREEKTSPPMALRLMKNPFGRALIKRIWSPNLAKKSLMDMVHDESLITDYEVERMWDFSRYPGNMEAMFREFSNNWPDFKSKDFENFAIKTLLIWGKEDTVCPTSMGEWYHAHLQNSAMVQVPKIGHNPQFECPDTISDEILPWMETLD